MSLKSRLLLRMMFTVIVLIFSSGASGTEDGETVDLSDIVLQSAKPLPLEPQIIGVGAIKALPGEWTTSLHYEYLKRACSATIVGPRTIITSAHCIPNKSRLTVKTDLGHKNILCTHHPQYVDPEVATDIALCHSNEKIELQQVSRYERISSNSDETAVGFELTLLGFGCRRYLGGGESGELFYGVAEITSHLDHYVVTKGGAAVCSGDSGGGAYRVYSSNRRALVGVSSQGDLLSRSYISTFERPGVIEYFHEYARTHALNICGVNLSGDDCFQ